MGGKAKPGAQASTVVIPGTQNGERFADAIATLSLESIVVPVVVMKPPNEQPQAAVGVSMDWPGAPMVVVGVGVTLPGGPSICLAAHIYPEHARQLASKILAAADQAGAGSGHA